MWEERYKNTDGYLFGTEPAKFLLENPGWLHPGLAGLSVADGEGRNSVYMAKQGLQMTAFDMSPTAVARAEKLARQKGVSANFNLSGWDDWEWNGSTYDLVAAIFIQFVGPSERGKQFANLKQAVKRRWRVDAARLSPGTDQPWHWRPAFCRKYVYIGNPARIFRRLADRAPCQL